MLLTQILSFLTMVAVGLVGILALVGLYMFTGGRTRRSLQSSDFSSR